MKSKKIIITTSWDDGHPLDIKLCSILQKYNIKGTIYIPILNKERDVMDEKEIKKISKNFEIGGHTYNHSVLTNLSNSEIDDEIIRSKKKMEEITDTKIISFCYPRGKYNKEIMKKVKNAGYVGGRTTEIFRTSFSNSFELHTTIQAVNRTLASRGKNVITSNSRKMTQELLFTKTLFNKWDVIAKKSLDYVLKNGGIWHLWGHSWEINDNNDWDTLEDVLEYVQMKGRAHNAEFVTNKEIFCM